MRTQILFLHPSRGLFVEEAERLLNGHEDTHAVQLQKIARQVAKVRGLVAVLTAIHRTGDWWSITCARGDCDESLEDGSGLTLSTDEV